MARPSTSKCQRCELHNCTTVADDFGIKANQKLNELEQLQLSKQEFYEALFQYFKKERDNLLGEVIRDELRINEKLERGLKIHYRLLGELRKFRKFFQSTPFIQMKVDAELYRDYVHREKVKLLDMQTELVQENIDEMKSRPEVKAYIAEEEEMTKLQQEKETLEETLESLQARQVIVKEMVEHVLHKNILDMVMTTKELQDLNAEVDDLKKQVAEQEAAEKAAAELEAAKLEAAQKEKKKEKAAAAGLVKEIKKIVEVVDISGCLAALEQKRKKKLAKRDSLNPHLNPDNSTGVLHFQARSKSMNALLDGGGDTNDTPKMLKTSTSGGTKRLIQSEPKVKTKRVRFSEDVVFNEKEAGDGGQSRKKKKGPEPSDQSLCEHQQQQQMERELFEQKQQQAREAYEKQQKERDEQFEEEQRQNDDEADDEKTVPEKQPVLPSTSSAPSPQIQATPKKPALIEKQQQPDERNDQSPAVPSTPFTPKRSVTQKRSGTPLTYPSPKIQATPKTMPFMRSTPVPATPKAKTPSRSGLQSPPTPSPESPWAFTIPPKTPARRTKSLQPKTTPEDEAPIEEKQLKPANSNKKSPPQDENINLLNKSDDLSDSVKDSEGGSDAGSDLGLNTSNESNEIFGKLMSSAKSAIGPTDYRPEHIVSPLARPSADEDDGGGFFLNNSADKSDSEFSDFFGLKSSSTNKLIF